MNYELVTIFWFIVSIISMMIGRIRRVSEKKYRELYRREEERSERLMSELDEVRRDVLRDDRK